MQTLIFWSCGRGSIGDVRNNTLLGASWSPLTDWKAVIPRI
ncbi:hypothetical protein J2X61_004655 [Bacillus sp. 3255]|nr:hypothetical protein [Bacillus sp. 3255]